MVEAKVTVPAGYFLQWSGQYEHQVRARNRLLLVVPACFAIIFILLWMRRGTLELGAQFTKGDVA